MAQQSDRQRDPTASSTGQSATAADWLDVHFEASRPEYQAQLRLVGFQPGWHVLDAGCGSGSFLPWLAELVGSDGLVVALDHAPENVAVVQQRLREWALPCPVEVRAGTVTALPYPDDTFDAVWFANTSQYLTDADLAIALAEFLRVVRPGGLVALKESDINFFRFFPAPPGLVIRWWQAYASTGNVWGTGVVRVSALPGWLRRVGLANVWQRSTLIEQNAPLRPAARSMWTSVLQKWAAAAPEMNLPAVDQKFWAQLREPGALERYLDDPDCSLIEGNILTVGTVPADQ